MGGASCVPDNKWGSSNGHHLASDKYNRVCDGVVNGDLGWVSTSSGLGCAMITMKFSSAII